MVSASALEDICVKVELGDGIIMRWVEVRWKSDVVGMRWGRIKGQKFSRGRCGSTRYTIQVYVVDIQIVQHLSYCEKGLVIQEPNKRRYQALLIIKGARRSSHFGPKTQDTPNFRQCPFNRVRSKSDEPHMGYGRVCRLTNGTDRDARFFTTC